MDLKTLGSSWWMYDSEKAAKSMDAVVDAINTDSQGIHTTNVQNLRLYTSNHATDYTISNYLVNAYHASRNSFLQRGSRMNHNICKAAVDSLTSKVAKEKIRPSFLTNGSWVEQKRRADKLDDCLYGEMVNSGFYKYCKQWFKDACIFGTGFMHIYREKDKDGKFKIKAERVFPDEIMVDPYDGYYSDPRTMYRMKYVSKDYLRQMGLTEYQLTQIPTVKGYGGSTRITETVEVIQAWHLPDNEGKNGRMMIQSNGIVIADEEWNRCRFPIAMYRFTQEPVGYFGSGVCQELLGDQVEINRLLNFIKESMMLVSNPRVFAKIGSVLSKQNMTNRIGGFIEYAGDTPPTIAPSVAVAGDVFQQLDRLWARGFEKIGLNELQISGQNQLGAGASGVAIREHTDVQSERFAEVQQNWEDSHVEVGHLIMDEMEEISQIEGDYIVSVSSMDKGTFELKYSDIKLPRDSYAIQCFPRSALPKTPGARLQTVSEMEATGFITKEQASELLNFPDLKAHNMMNEMNNIRFMIEKIITQKAPKKGEEWFTLVPDAYMNFRMGLEMGRKYYTMLMNELPEDTEGEQEDKAQRLDLLRNWNDMCTDLIKEEEQARMQAEAEAQAPQALPPEGEPQMPMPGQPPMPMPMPMTMPAQIPPQLPM